MEAFRLLALFITLVTINVDEVTGLCEGTETFEKVTGVTLFSAKQIPLYSAQEGPVTAECNNRCRNSASCPAFVINYDRSACYRLDLTSDGRRQLLQPVTGHVAYFEKICLQAPACGKAWVFERVPGQQLDGLDDLVLEGISSRRQCQDYCLLNHQLPCRSAEYVAGRRLCRISASSRRTAPLSLRPASDTDYLENLCAPQGNSQDCDWEEWMDREMVYSDLQLVTSVDTCRRACETAAAFRCRSFTYTPSRSLCQLSSEDTFSAGPQALRQNAAAIFHQRAPCADLELVCAVDRMTVRLKTEEPFSGRIFALDAPNSCEVRGSGQRITEATFHYTDGRCGAVRESTESFTTLVVIQRHALIQRWGDRAIKLLCTYSTAEQTVSSGLDLLVDRIDGDLVTATVNATAATPRVSLHVRDAAGADVSGAVLGEQLFLTLELDDNSIFGMSASSLVARGGSSGESIVLTDERGCPTDESIFRGFTTERGVQSILTAPFEAFKFSEDPVVRFQINVQFCLDRCPQAQCDAELRRRRASPGAAPVTRQRTVRETAPLQREIFVEGGRVRRAPRTDTSAGGEPDGEELLCARTTAVAGGVAALTLIQACLLMTCLVYVYQWRQRRLRDELPPSSVLYDSRQRLGPLEASRPAPLHVSTLRKLRAISLQH